MTSLELKGAEALTHLNSIAALRISVFAEWPYLYEGDLAHEKDYLESYFKSQNSFIVLALDGKEVVGASTAIWLPDADEAFQAPFVARNIALESVCYYGESVLKAAYRGRGVGKEFMMRRERFAKTFPTVTHCAFCGVVRPETHPKHDPNYRKLDEFWKKAGFEPQKDMVAFFPWKDIGDSEDTEKPLQFWMKRIRK